MIDKVSIVLIVIFVVSLALLSLMHNLEKPAKPIKARWYILFVSTFLLSVFMLHNVSNLKYMITKGYKVHEVYDNKYNICGLGMFSDSFNEKFRSGLLDIIADNKDSKSFDTISYIGDDLNVFDIIKYSFYPYNLFLGNCEVVANTGVLEANGSDLTAVSDVYRIYTSRGGYSYNEDTFLRYKDTCFKTGRGKESSVDIDNNKTYIIEYALDSKGTISDLSDNVTCYTECKIYDKVK